MTEEPERGCPDCDDMNCSGECASDLYRALARNDMEGDDG